MRLPPALAPRGLALAAASGFAATVALRLGPYGEAFPQVFLPFTGIDVQLFLLSAVFLGVHILLSGARWPWPALALPALALGAAALAHFHASALLGLFTTLPGTGAGERVDIVRALASGASLVLALAAALDRGRDRLMELARAQGIADEALRPVARAADAHAARTLGFTAAVFAALTLVAALGDALAGGAQAPLAEVAGAALAVGVAALLFPGLGAGARDAKP